MMVGRSDMEDRKNSSSPKGAFGRNPVRARRVSEREEEERGGEQGARSSKRSWKPGTMLAPVPAVLVSCGGTKEYRPNIITLGWAGTVCSEPPMVSISIRPQRYSHEIISRTRDFVLNVTTAELAMATDWCGVKSGRDVDKFAETRLTPMPSDCIAAPGILESPVNMECKVKKIIQLGSHDMFIAEIVAVHISGSLLSSRGKLCLDSAGLLAYAHGEYYVLGRKLGYFGYSVKKR